MAYGKKNSNENAYFLIYLEESLKNPYPLLENESKNISVQTMNKYQR